MCGNGRCCNCTSLLLDDVPFLIIRGISDSPNGNNGIDYFEYCNIAAKQATNILEELIKNYMK